MSRLEALEARIAALAVDFRARLPARREALIAARQRMAAGDESVRPTLANEAHKLRGTAATYGHDEMSKLAARVEQAAEGASTDVLLETLDDLIRSMASVEQASNEPAAPNESSSPITTRHASALASIPAPGAVSSRESTPVPGARSSPEKTPAPGALSSPESTPVPGALSSSEAAPSSGMDKPLLRVLVLDDDEGTRRLLSVCLRPASGFRTTVAASWAEAFARLSEAAFDLVVTDWMMPDGDGLSFVRDLRAAGGLNVDVPVVVLSAAAPREAPDGDPAPSAWIQKPFVPRQLIARLVDIARTK